MTLITNKPLLNMIKGTHQAIPYTDDSKLGILLMILRSKDSIYSTEWLMNTRRHLGRIYNDGESPKQIKPKKL